jgi:hypothetical protein
MQTQPGADASAPTTTNTSKPTTYGVPQPKASGISQNGCNAPKPTAQQDTNRKATMTKNAHGSAISEGGAGRTRPSPHRSHSRVQPHPASQFTREPTDEDQKSDGSIASYDSSERHLYGRPARRANSRIRHVTGVNAVRPPHFTSVNAKAMHGAKRKILDYEDRVRNHNQIHGLDNKPLQVLFMLKEGLARALIEEILRPDDTFDSNNTLHQNAIRDYMFQKENTPGVNSHIKIETFEREMRKIKMDINDYSWVSRTMTFLNKITLLLEDTRVKMTDKKLVKLCMRSVEPYRLRKRMYGLIESGCEDDKAAGKNIQVWKTMLRRETRLDWESEFRLRGVSTDARRGGFQNSKGRGIRRFNGGSITRPPNNVRIKSRPVNFRKNPPSPLPL